jgi:two-component sensor histidine kinase
MSFPDRERISIEGDALYAPLPMSPMSLVFHELMTNSVKHGERCQCRRGHVRIELSAYEDFMRIEWRETGGPQIMQETVTAWFWPRLKQLSIDVQMRGLFNEIWDKKRPCFVIELPLPDMPSERAHKTERSVVRKKDQCGVVSWRRFLNCRFSY